MATTKGKRAKRKPKAKEPPPLEPWERQPGETAVAFQAFARYRDMGAGRTGEGGLRRVARELGKSGSLIGRWSVEHGWVARAAAWDAELDRTRREELEADQIAAARRHAQIARAHMTVLSRSTQALLEKLERNPELINDLDPATLLQLSVQAARVTPRLVVSERLSLGISTTNIGGADGGPLLDPAEKARGMSDAELDAFLLGAATAAEGQPE